MRCSCYPFISSSTFFHPQKKTFPIKRGPPNLQKEGNVSDVVGGEKQEQEVVQEAGGGEDEDKEKKIVR